MKTPRHLNAVQHRGGHDNHTEQQDNDLYVEFTADQYLDTLLLCHEQRLRLVWGPAGRDRRAPRLVRIRRDAADPLRSSRAAGAAGPRGGSVPRYR